MCDAQERVCDAQERVCDAQERVCDAQERVCDAQERVCDAQERVCDAQERVCDAQECVGKNPTDRAKAGVKRSLLVEGGGGPLGIVIAGANVPDAQLLQATIEAAVVERPRPTAEEPQHLCLDKGYDNAPAEAVVTGAGYVPHVRRIGEEKKDSGGQKTRPARRWVVERTFAWLSRWRGILIRWEKKADNYLATLKLACALIWFRKCRALA